MKGRGAIQRRDGARHDEIDEQVDAQPGRGLDDGERIARVLIAMLDTVEPRRGCEQHKHHDGTQPLRDQRVAKQERQRGQGDQPKHAGIDEPEVNEERRAHPGGGRQADR